MCICIYKCVSYSPAAQRTSSARLKKIMTGLHNPGANQRHMDTKIKKQGKTQVVPIRVTPEEKERLLELAQAHGLKLSEYMRQAGLIQEITSRTEVETVLQLAKINADQARLGNLLKLAIDMENYSEVEQLIAEIRQTQQELKKAVHRV